MKESTAIFVLVFILCAFSFVGGMLYQRGHSKKVLPPVQLNVSDCAIPFMPTPEPKSNIGETKITTDL